MIHIYGHDHDPLSLTLVQRTVLAAESSFYSFSNNVTGSTISTTEDCLHGLQQKYNGNI